MLCKRKINSLVCCLRDFQKNLNPLPKKIVSVGSLKITIKPNMCKTIRNKAIFSMEKKLDIRGFYKKYVLLLVLGQKSDN